MKIVFVSGPLKCGGSERVMSILANSLADEHQISMLTTSSITKPFFPLKKSIKVYSLIENIHELKKIRGSLRFRKLICSIKPDIIISFQDRVNLFTLVCCFGLNTPIIISERNHPQHKPISPFLGKIKKYFYPKASHLVVQTRSIQQWFTHKQYKNKDISIIPNPLEKLVIQDIESPKRKFIIACGRLVPQKGFIELIEIFADIANNYPDWDLRIIGEGPYRQRIENKIEELKLKNRVFLEGYMTEPHSLLLKGEIFTLTSYYEGFPNVLAEAMACGKAVISYDCPSGPADMIENEVNGLLIENQNKDAFKLALTELIDNPPLRKRLGNKALSLSKTLSADKITEQWLTLINRTVKKYDCSLRKIK